ncbi:hypothetical protein BJF93_10325 [Xaviernesmea oryzae]|uniref:Peptidase M15A C-terminal domain-containing protein n=1 Tax=Xaviernesmea oryzae TaxID=464029 RepID=A0A1Q9AX08_9HYPH|nr:D-Ala-D-Ala carboxypeptidase family metallohydrolase [Xaviernesmea oryzae]OLP59971.1 hypothetical protein BJF93_10325 [Xaviernesmea oryzae]SEK42240.1 Uncharacterized conserved protein YcbK, DUF882 family [Xaviernesmea oryzae]
MIRPTLRLFFGLLISASLLSGCVSSKETADKATDALYEAAQEEAAKGQVTAAAHAPRLAEPAVAQAGGQAASQADTTAAQPALLTTPTNGAAPVATAAPAALDSPEGGVVMQGTAVNAMSGSIFSNRQAGQGGAPRSLFEPPAAAAYPQTTVPLPPQAAPVAQPESSDAGSGSSLIGLFAKPGKGSAALGKEAAKGAAKIPAGTTPQQIAALSYKPLPGIRARSMFATVDDMDPEHDDNSPRVSKASLPGLARLAASGFWLEQANVDSSCFRPDLRAILKSVETRFGRKVLVTSGHRTPVHNARVGGVPKSRHLTCEAADIQVAGVGKLELASYLRSLPTVGGVGTYCHTQSVHVDTGTRRDWNWDCKPRNV